MSAANESTTSKFSNVSSPDAYEDDLVTWLQYPTDNQFERTYCSDVFQAGWPPTVDAAHNAHPGVATHKNDSTVPCIQTNLSNAAASAPTYAATLAAKHMGTKTASMSTSSCNFSAEEALAQGAARAAGYSSQVGRDAYSKVRTIMQPTQAYPQPSSRCDSQNSSKVLKDHPMKPNLPLSSVPAFPPCPLQNVTGAKRSVIQSPSISTDKNTASMFKRARKDFEVQSQTHQTGTSRITEEGTQNRAKIMGASTKMPMSCSASQTSMSLSSREMECSGNGKQEDSDLLSEEFTNVDSMDMKKHVKLSSRRNRVAEVHNLSERNRRNRINDKLKTLQELIPNSTKASCR